MHGCFWHRHPGCKLARMPKSRLDFWRPKLEGNRERDLRNQIILKNMGWDVLVIWECEMKNVENIMNKVKSFLTKERDKHEIS